MENGSCCFSNSTKYCASRCQGSFRDSLSPLRVGGVELNEDLFQPRSRSARSAGDNWRTCLRCARRASINGTALPKLAFRGFTVKALAVPRSGTYEFVGIVDAGSDSGVVDAGSNADIVDAGSNAGIVDAGSGSDVGFGDTGSDVGIGDAGSDAGAHAGAGIRTSDCAISGAGAGAIAGEGATGAEAKTPAGMTSIAMISRPADGVQEELTKAALKPHSVYMLLRTDQPPA